MFRDLLLLLGENGALLTFELAPQLRRRLDQPRISDQLTQLVMINLVQVHEHDGVSVVVRGRKEGAGILLEQRLLLAQVGHKDHQTALGLSPQPQAPLSFPATLYPDV